MRTEITLLAAPSDRVILKQWSLYQNYPTDGTFLSELQNFLFVISVFNNGDVFLNA